MSYGWRWAWLGFCKSWETVKKTYNNMRKGKGTFPKERKWTGFHQHFSFHSIDAWHTILWDHPATSRKTKLFRGMSKWKRAEVKKNSLPKARLRWTRQLDLNNYYVTPHRLTSF